MGFLEHLEELRTRIIRACIAIALGMAFAFIFVDRIADFVEAFFGTFNSPKMKFMPRVEDTFDLYKTTLLGMVAVFQLPTLVYFLARMGLVTAGFLWRHVKYAVLAIFIIAAVLTPSSDPWNQTVFAAPMIALYVISIGVAWLVSPKRKRDPEPRGGSTTLRLVVGAMVVDQVRGHRLRSHNRA